MPAAQTRGRAYAGRSAGCAADRRAGFCTVGPTGRILPLRWTASRPVFASQGQQRSAVLSLKLAEASVAQSVTGEHPVMLLDDVLSELDPSGRNTC